MNDPVAYMIDWPVWMTYAAIMLYLGHRTGAAIARLIRARP